MKNLEIINKFENLSDKDIYKIAKRWGADVLRARRKFAGLLPEIYHRDIREREMGRSWFQKRGFTCIYEFAAKLGGMSRDQVNEYIRIEKKCENKPILKEALITGEVSINKLSRIMSIATVDNQKEMLEKVQTMSKVALDVYVKDLKNEKPEGLYKPKSDQNGLYGQTKNLDWPHEKANLKTTKHTNDQATLNLDENVLKQLLEMQNKGIDINKFLSNALKERTKKIEQEKEELSKQEIQKTNDRAIIGYPAPRHVRIKIKKVLELEFGTKCSAHGCNKRATQLHHQKPFAIYKTHDPNYLKPLCRGHHELQHPTKQYKQHHYSHR